MSAVRIQTVAAAAITARGLIGVTIDHHAMKHRMVHAAHFMFDDKDPIAFVRIDQLFEAELVIAHFFGNQSTLFEKRVRAGKVGDVNGDVVAVVVGPRLIGFFEYERLVAADFHSRDDGAAAALSRRRRSEYLIVKARDGRGAIHRRPCGLERHLGHR